MVRFVSGKENGGIVTLPPGYRVLLANQVRRGS